MKQRLVRKTFSLWFIEGVIQNQLFFDAKADYRRVPSAGRGEGWLSELMTCMSPCLSEIQFFHQSCSKVGHSFLNAV